MRNSFLILFFTLATVFNTVSAQNRFTISGKITEYFSDNSMGGVSIKLQEKGNYVNNVVSDGKGIYELELAFDKEYAILYEKAGFEAKKYW